MLSYSLFNLNILDRLEQLDQVKKKEFVNYFSRNAVFLRTLDDTVKDSNFFKLMLGDHPIEYKQVVEGDMDKYIDTIQTFKYLDRDTFICKFCQFYCETRETVKHHINEFHIKPKRRMSEEDLVIEYIEHMDENIE